MTIDTKSKQVKILGKSKSNILESESVIKQFVSEMIAMLGMQILGQPHIYQVDLELSKLNRTPFEDEGGISCLACLSTSHVAIHTWPLRNEFHLDIYSCREFSYHTVRNFVQDKLCCEQIKITDLTNSCNWL